MSFQHPQVPGSPLVLDNDLISSNKPGEARTMAEGRDEKKSTQSAQQAEQATKRVAETAADVSGRVAAIGVKVVKRGNESAQHLWEASTNMATQLSQQASDQYGRVFGVSGDEAQKTLEDTSRNLSAVLESTKAIASASEEFSRQWLETLRKTFDQTISRSEALSRCRTPHEFFGMQAELTRENLNTVLHGTRQLAEISARVAQEATNKMSDRIRQAA
jgi:phasin family protein